MTYAEAMEKYGSDKPDIRFGNPLVDVTEVFRRHASESFAAKVPVADCQMKVVAFDGGPDPPSTTQLRALEKEVGHGA